jgi:hypothetical protein
VQYLLLIYNEPSAYTDMTPEESSALTDQYWAFDRMVRETGEHVSGEALESPEVTTAVRVRDGEVITTDGPFVETKELLAGYYLVDCKDLDRAIELAAQIPDAARGRGVIEVRPIVVFEPPESAS